MTKARLQSITIERFKSHVGPTTVEFGALTVLIGRNNSGKSSVMQALLLLKQTLSFPRTDVSLHLRGPVDALNLRELTYGWPNAAAGEDEIQGPSFVINWTSEIESATRDFAEKSILKVDDQVKDFPTLKHSLSTTLRLDYFDLNSKVILKKIQLESVHINNADNKKRVYTFERQNDGEYLCKVDGIIANKIVVELDHFLPYVSINKRNVGPNDRQRVWVSNFTEFCLQPIEDLKILLGRFEYLTSTRDIPPTLYSHSTISPDSIGMSGQQAAELLQANRTNFVHYIPPKLALSDKLTVPLKKGLQEAVNDVLAEMGIDTPLSIHDIPDVGFRLLFGKANLQHVGRGLTYLLPIVELGLIGDPLRFQNVDLESRDEYQRAGSTICAFEEPEAHLHPKIQSRLAEWFISLGQSQRQVVVETHSDHLVRRLRSIIASSVADGDLEKWLKTNINIVNVEQHNGITTVRCTGLTKDGGIEEWPGDFFDEAAQQENQIYASALEKEHLSETSSTIIFEHESEFEPNEDNS